MFGKGNSRHKAARVVTLIGQGTELRGDLHFSGGIHIDGAVKGNVIADGDAGSVLTLSEHGSIEGEVRVPNIRLNGTVVGNVYGSEHVELAPQARITGNVYYNLIEMAIGAEVNGNLVHRSEADEERSVVPLEIPAERQHGPGNS